MKKKRNSLVFKFAIIFAVFTFVTVISSGVHTYFLQTNAEKERSKKDIAEVAEYLEALMAADAHNFKKMQEWWVEHVDEVFIPLDYDGNCWPERVRFETMFARKYPGKVFDVDITVEQLDKETLAAWAIWYYKFWMNIFETARDSFNVLYTYYMFPRGEDNHLYWMIDAVREPFENPTEEQKEMIDLTDDYFDGPLEEFPNAKKIWETKAQTHEYDIYDNEYGKTYGYYVPFIVDGEILGLVGVDIEIDTVNHEVLKNALINVAGQTLILVVAVLILLLIIYRKYIQKLIHLQLCVLKYTREKDPSIAEEIECIKSGRDEISVLTSQVSAMIIEMENYIRSLFKTNQELKNTQEYAKEMNELAIKDALTGIRNKTAYDREVSRLAWKIQQGETDFGIAMVDLNFLKQLNDTYGHEQGNKAIKRLSKIICHIFKHSPVFRIGGDEFVVILENSDLSNISSLLGQFENEMEKEKQKISEKPWECVSAAIGVAIFESGRDRTVQNVFERADKAMYNYKRAMKANRT